uniref:Uncharacterized protein n=1 Tax=Podoviridae sp. ctsNK10 TaxID=2826582 RepID=A0A8S5NKA8_9CAUD|nr:MAG TPA: hypothetical protein [Podoviridae sp. ctsNK10]DAJ73326.1 MAG TPA: hypothetical protein [Caudoviricetes sp.]
MVEKLDIIRTHTSTYSSSGISIETRLTLKQ